MARTVHCYRKPRTWTAAFDSLIAVLLLLLATPALAVDNGHTGTATPRSAPELSDVALFVMAAAGVWFTRRALRNRMRKD